MTTELLAPAGGQEALVAAVQSGADAVYMGFGAFNARRSARNFSDEEFRAAVSYCHLRGVKVYLTLNTLVTDRELPALAEEARVASECGVDAILVQDWGVLAALREIIPDVPLHASTQMSLHTLSGVAEAARLGMTRAVLARELNREEIAEICPVLDVSRQVRYPVLGATWQPRAGIAKHDHVAWGFARALHRMGVDLVQNCQVTGFERVGDAVVGVRTTRGTVRAGKVALAAAGHTSVLADELGLRLPLQSHPLQALVSELLEPVHPTVVMSNAVHVYVSQAHKGELVLGAGIDSYNSYGQRGAFHTIERELTAAVELFPVFSRAHVLRTWAGVVDVTPDASAIMGRTPFANLYVNCGWGTGGFKATPGVGWCYAHTIAHDEPHPLNAPFGLERFTTGALVDEHGAAGVAH